MSGKHASYYRRPRRRRGRGKGIWITLAVLMASVLMIIGGVKLIVENWAAPAGISGELSAPGVDAEDWRLALVNPWNPIQENYEPELTELRNGETVDSRIYPELQKMFDDARDCGLEPYVTSGYRTNEVQQSLMDEEIENYLSQGYSEEEARQIAEQWVAVPGTSEHQVGLAVDISMEDNGRQGASDLWQWLMENSYKYGFILRYPEDKTAITGIGYEPWHYRYVGKETAEKIYRKGICLEEYLND